MKAGKGHPVDLSIIKIMADKPAWKESYGDL